MLISRLFTKQALLIYLLIIIALAALTIYSLNRNPYGDHLSIANLDKYTAGKETNKKRVQLIEYNLYKTVKLNTRDKIADNSIKDILIRDNTFKQTLDKRYGIYTVEFIVDIQSFRQSYKVSYQWAKNSRNDQFINEYGTQVSCLPIDMLRYGDFHCKDERIIERGVENFDPIGLILPYHVPSKYKVVDYIKTKNSSITVVQVEAYAPRWVAKINQSLLDKYTKEIKVWIKSRKLNPDNYMIVYTNS